MSNPLREDWRVVLAVVSGGHFLSHFYLLALPPLFPLLSGEFGLNNTKLGLIISALTLGGLLQAPVGNLVDRIGAKWIFVVAVGVTAGGIALIGVWPSYPMLLALATVSGIGQAGFHPADYSLIDSVADPDAQGRAFSIHTFSGFAGFAVAPLVVGALAALTNWRIALGVVGGVGVLYAVFSTVALAPVYRRKAETDSAHEREADPDDTSFLSVRRQPGLLVMVGFFVLMSFAVKGIQGFTPVLAIDGFGLPESVGGSLLTVYFALGSLGVLVGGFLADRYDPSRVIAGGLAMGASTLVVTASGLIPISALSLVVAFALIGFCISLVFPSRDRLVTEHSAAGSLGRSFGIVFTGGTVGGLVGPVVLGAVGDATTITLSFVLIGGCYLLAATLAFSLGQGWLTPQPARSPIDGD
jgi:MFS family permease